MRGEVVISALDPGITLLAQQKIEPEGVMGMAEWVRQHRPDCVPISAPGGVFDLLPHDQFDDPHDLVEHKPRNQLTDNEVLCEIAGRKCYDSFAEKAGKKTNQEYFEHIVSMDPIHSSILYHAKMTFFFAGVSRKFSHQFIRNYVGSDRDEEGSPSQESTRFTYHYGWYIAPPFILQGEPGAVEVRVESFRRACQANYDAYRTFVDAETIAFERRTGAPPKGGDKKDIFEAGAGYLSMSAETSFVWTTNPMALRKFLKERCHGAADAEIFRFAKKLARLCFDLWPNLFLGKDLDGVRKEIEHG